MYCPKCAAQNIDDAQFCRACGANISLVSHALTGRLPSAVGAVPPMAPLVEMQDFGRRKRLKNGGAPSVDKGIKHIFMGVGFLLVAISIALFGHQSGDNAWWYWMLIPAFSLLGGGVSEIVRAKHWQRLASPSQQPTIQPSFISHANELPPRHTAAMTPPSVTEATTRHLNAEVAPSRSDAGVENRARKSND